MKKALLFLAFATLFTGLYAQEIARTIVVEHYTNSRCGICASRNPGFYNNLNQQDGILHISYHPSSPYANCVLHQVNPAENNDRTNFYGIFGGTPRLVIQGSVLSAGANYGSASIWDDHLNQTTPVSIDIRQQKENGEVGVAVTLTAVADNSIGEASLFVGLTEDVVFYDAPNGEDEHYDVFRKTFDGNTTGSAVAIPATAGESLTLTLTTTPDANWDYDRLYAMVILQNSDDKSVIQAAATDPSDNEPLVSTSEINTIGANIFPNPVQDQLIIQVPAENDTRYLLTNTQGQVLQQGVFQQFTQLDVATLPAGVYWLTLEHAQGRAVRKLVK